MTYSPTMKFHNYFPKNIFYCIFLIYILSSCASLNTSNKTYNLEGKISYISNDLSAIFLINVNTDLQNIEIKLYEPLNTVQVANFTSYNNNWSINNESLLNLKSILPAPKNILSAIQRNCLKKDICKFDFSMDKEVKIKVLLKNV